MVGRCLLSLVVLSAATFKAASMSPPAAEQLRNVPILIGGVLGACLTVAFLSLWWNARDYRVFLTMGLYFCVLERFFLRRARCRFKNRFGSFRYFSS